MPPQNRPGGARRARPRGRRGRRRRGAGGEPAGEGAGGEPAGEGAGGEPDAAAAAGGRPKPRPAATKVFAGGSRGLQFPPDLRVAPVHDFRRAYEEDVDGIFAEAKRVATSIIRAAGVSSAAKPANHTFATSAQLLRDCALGAYDAVGRGHVEANMPDAVFNSALMRARAAWFQALGDDATDARWAEISQRVQACSTLAWDRINTLAITSNGNSKRATSYVRARVEAARAASAARAARHLVQRGGEGIEDIRLSRELATDAFEDLRCLTQGLNVPEELIPNDLWDEVYRCAFGFTSQSALDGAVYSIVGRLMNVSEDEVMWLDFMQGIEDMHARASTKVTAMTMVASAVDIEAMLISRARQIVTAWTENLWDAFRANPAQLAAKTLRVHGWMKNVRTGSAFLLNALIVVLAPVYYIRMAEANVEKARRRLAEGLGAAAAAAAADDDDDDDDAAELVDDDDDDAAELVDDDDAAILVDDDDAYAEQINDMIATLSASSQKLEAYARSVLEEDHPHFEGMFGPRRRRGGLVDFYAIDKHAKQLSANSLTTLHYQAKKRFEAWIKAEVAALQLPGANGEPPKVSADFLSGKKRREALIRHVVHRVKGLLSVDYHSWAMRPDRFIGFEPSETLRNAVEAAQLNLDTIVETVTTEISTRLQVEGEAVPWVSFVWVSNNPKRQKFGKAPYPWLVTALAVSEARVKEIREALTARLRDRAAAFRALFTDRAAIRRFVVETYVKHRWSEGWTRIQDRIVIRNESIDQHAERTLKRAVRETIIDRISLALERDERLIVPEREEFANDVKANLELIAEGRAAFGSTEAQMRIANELIAVLRAEGVADDVIPRVEEAANHVFVGFQSLFEKMELVLNAMTAQVDRAQQAAAEQAAGRRNLSKRERSELLNTMRKEVIRVVNQPMAGQAGQPADGRAGQPADDQAGAQSDGVELQVGPEGQAQANYLPPLLGGKNAPISVASGELTALELSRSSLAMLLGKPRWDNLVRLQFFPDFPRDFNGLATEVGNFFFKTLFSPSAGGFLSVTSKSRRKNGGMLFYKRGSLSFYIEVAKKEEGAEEGEVVDEGAEEEGESGHFDVYVGIDPGMKDTLAMTEVIKNTDGTYKKQSDSIPACELHALMRSKNRSKETRERREVVMREALVREVAVARGEGAVENELAKYKASHAETNGRAHAAVTLVPGAYQQLARDYVARLLKSWGREAPERDGLNPRVFFAVGKCGVTSPSRAAWHQSPMKGHLRTSQVEMLKEIFKALRKKPTIMLIDQKYTSALCPYCGLGLSPAMQHDFSFSQTGRRLSAEKTRCGRVCTNNECSRARECVNRDASAALNMLRKAVKETANDEGGGDEGGGGGGDEDDDDDDDDDDAEGGANRAVVGGDDEEDDDGDDLFIEYRLDDEERVDFHAGLVEALRGVGVLNAAFGQPRDDAGGGGDGPALDTLEDSDADEERRAAAAAAAEAIDSLDAHAGQRTDSPTTQEGLRARAGGTPPRRTRPRPSPGEERPNSGVRRQRVGPSPGANGDAVEQQDDRGRNDEPLNRDLNREFEFAACCTIS